jgi:hypothetical protein
MPYGDAIQYFTDTPFDARDDWFRACVVDLGCRRMPIDRSPFPWKARVAGCFSSIGQYLEHYSSN